MEKYSGQMDNHENYNSHIETLNTPNISTNSSTAPTNVAENDSENNFDDGSSCASDSAIGVYWTNKSSITSHYWYK